MTEELKPASLTVGYSSYGVQKLLRDCELVTLKHVVYVSLGLLLVGLGPGLKRYTDNN